MPNVFITCKRCLGQGNVFTHVCLFTGEGGSASEGSVYRGGSVCRGGQIPTGTRKNMRYASYWNTFLLIMCQQYDKKKSLQFVLNTAGFPLGLENLEKWEGISQSGKSQGTLNRLEKSGKIAQNTGKLR